MVVLKKMFPVSLLVGDPVVMVEDWNFVEEKQLFPKELKLYTIGVLVDSVLYLYGMANMRQSRCHRKAADIDERRKVDVITCSKLQNSTCAFPQVCLSRHCSDHVCD